MGGFTATRTEIVDYKDASGVPFKTGDTILIRVKKEDIVCRFVGVIEGYFTTETIDGAHTSKYRLGSIGTVTRINGILPYEEAEE